MINELFLENDAHPMYVLTNSIEINGAACIMYENVIKDFAEMMESNLIILSSSTHEVLLMMDDGATEYEKLIEMVSYINATEVLETDVLSNNINQYNRQFEQLVMVLWF